MEVWQDFGQRIDLAVRCAPGLLPLREHPDTLATLMHMLHVRGRVPNCNQRLYAGSRMFCLTTQKEPQFSKKSFR